MEQLDGGRSSSSPANAPANKKEKRKEKFLRKIINGDEFTKSSCLQKRLPTLKTKASLLQTYCDISVCVVAADADGNVNTLWPEDPEKAREVIESYRKADKKQKKEMTVLDYLEENVKKLEKKKEKKDLRALGRRLLDWIDGMEGDGEALAAAIRCLGSKIDELEGRIKNSSVEAGGKGKLAETESDKVGPSSSSPAPLAWVPCGNGGGSSDFVQTHCQFPSIVNQGVLNGTLTSLPFQETQSAFFQGYGDQQFPSIGNEGASNGTLTSLSPTERQNALFQGSGSGGSSDLAQTHYQFPSIGNEGVVSEVDGTLASLSLTESQSSLFQGYGDGGRHGFGLYETLPEGVWEARQDRQPGFGGNGQSDFSFGY